MLRFDQILSGQELSTADERKRGGVLIVQPLAMGRRKSPFALSYRCGYRFADAHRGPVVAEFFAAIQAHDISPVPLPRSWNESHGTRRCQGKRGPAVSASQK